MTVSGRDIYASAATLLIREHGSWAKSVAENRAAELKVAGDEAGYAAFIRIAAAVRELGQLEPAVSSPWPDARAVLERPGRRRVRGSVAVALALRGA